MKQEIRKLLGTDKIILGTERSLKALAAGKLTKIIIASNCADETRKTIDETLGKTELVVADEDNEELGVLCKKPFRVAVIGIL